MIDIEEANRLIRAGWPIRLLEDNIRCPACSTGWMERQEVPEGFSPYWWCVNCGVTWPGRRKEVRDDGC